MESYKQLKQNWNQFRTDGLFSMLFVEPKREQKRLRSGRAKVADIFVFRFIFLFGQFKINRLFSSTKDYCLLRLISGQDINQINNLPILGHTYLFIFRNCLSNN